MDQRSGVKANIPRQHASNTRPWGPGDQETHRGVRHRVPSPAHKQNDGGVEGVQLEIKGGENNKSYVRWSH